MKCQKCENNNLTPLPYTYSTRKIPVLLVLLDVFNAAIVAILLTLIISAFTLSSDLLDNLLMPSYNGSDSFKEITDFFESFIKYYVLIQVREIVLAPFISFAIINFVILLIPYKTETTIVFCCNKCGNIIENHIKVNINTIDD